MNTYKDYVKIPDSRVIMRWKCPECKETADWDPTMYENNGTPQCECGEDMSYKGTFIRLKGYTPRRNIEGNMVDYHFVCNGDKVTKVK